MSKGRKSKKKDGSDYSIAVAAVRGLLLQSTPEGGSGQWGNSAGFATRPTFGESTVYGAGTLPVSTGILRPTEHGEHAVDGDITDDPTDKAARTDKEAHTDKE